MSEAAEEMKRANLDTNVILFSMWTEAIKNFAEVSKGECDLPRWQQPGDGKYDAADPIADDEECRNVAGVWHNFSISLINRTPPGAL